MPGADPPVLRFDAASSSRVRVAAEASAQVRVRDRLTVAARVRPTQDTAQGGIIVNKEGEYELARFPDGTLRYALANMSPGWNWIDPMSKAESLRTSAVKFIGSSGECERNGIW